MISLSLCMIVKNEEKVLPRILKPMKEIVDKILICDTGSTDRTKEIIREFTAEVYDFPWKNDFSAARNFISEKVSTDYWMWLDADDMITQENLFRLKRRANFSDFINFTPCRALSGNFYNAFCNVINFLTLI